MLKHKKNSENGGVATYEAIEKEISAILIHAIKVLDQAAIADRSDGIFNLKIDAAISDLKQVPHLVKGLQASK